MGFRKKGWTEGRGDVGGWGRLERKGAGEHWAKRGGSRHGKAAVVLREERETDEGGHRRPQYSIKEEGSNNKRYEKKEVTSFFFKRIWDLEEGVWVSMSPKEDTNVKRKRKGRTPQVSRQAQKKSIARMPIRKEQTERACAMEQLYGDENRITEGDHKKVVW